MTALAKRSDYMFRILPIGLDRHPAIWHDPRFTSSASTWLIHSFYWIPETFPPLTFGVVMDEFPVAG